MRFQPDHDPDPERRKFRTIKSLEDMPQDYLDKWDQLDVRLRELIAEQKERRSLDDFNALIRYLAFQELQIHNLQEEVKVTYQIIEEITQVVDELHGSGPSQG